MGLTVAEIRNRAERFRAAVVEEVYEARAGRKSYPELASLYEAEKVLSFPETIPVIERELAAAQGEEERRLRRLQRWVAEHHLAAANVRLDDEHAYWIHTATVQANGVNLPVSQAAAVVATTANRTARRRLDEALATTHEEILPLQLDRLSRWRSAIAELGYGSYRAATERLTGMNLTGLLHEARKIVVETEELYRDQLDYHLRKYASGARGTAEGHDARWLARMRWLDGLLEGETVIEIVRKDLADIGLPLDASGRVALEHEAFPGPGMTSWCAPIRVPDRVALVIIPTLTPAGCIRLLAEIGRAVHYGYTDRDLPFEYRALGDLSVAEAHAELFAGLGRSRPWALRAGLPNGERLAEYLRLAAFVDLYWLRRTVCRLEFELELADSERPADMGPRWSELLRRGTSFRFDHRGFLEQLGQRFGVARELRARMLAAQLTRVLRNRFDEDWFRNPRAGPFLVDWLARGLGATAVELAAELGQKRLGAEQLIASIEECFG